MVNFRAMRVRLRLESREEQYDVMVAPLGVPSVIGEEVKFLVDADCVFFDIVA